MKPHDEEAFRSFVAARSPALLRSAYVLTGDHGRAEDLVRPHDDEPDGRLMVAPALA